MSSNSVIEIESSDVIKLLLQFLKENNLNTTFDALQKESQISLNTVVNPEMLSSDIRSGLWDNVLNAISSLKLPVHKLINLYEHIILELAELREMDVSRTLLKQTQAMTILKQTQPERYLKLETILTRTFLEPKELYPQGNKGKRRQDLANEIMREITVVEPSRLLSLLSQSLKYQEMTGTLPDASTGLVGTRYDLFRGRIPTKEEEEEVYLRLSSKTMKFTGKSCPEVARFSPDGLMLVTGAMDGFIEVYNPVDGRLRTDLKYQERERFMMHEGAVLSLNFSKNGEFLVSGSQDGTIKIWKLLTGQCVRDLPNIHAQGVTSVSLSRDDGQILSSSFDGNLAIHGAKSGKTLRVFKGHTSYVNAAHFTRDNKFIVSGSADGTVRVWDALTASCLQVFTPGKISVEIDIHTILPMPNYGEHQFIVSNKTNTIYLMNNEGEIVKTFAAPLKVEKSNKNEKSNENFGTDFITACLSPKANWLYGITEDSTMYCFNVLSGEMIHSMTIHEKDVIGVHHHPFRNLMCTYSTDGQLKLWKP